MKKALIRISAIVALLVLIPLMNNTLKANNIKAQVTDEELRVGTAVQVSLALFGLGNIVFVQDKETGAILIGYTYQDVDSGDTVTYIKDPKKPKGNIIIKDVVKTNQ